MRLQCRRPWGAAEWRLETLSAVSVHVSEASAGSVTGLAGLPDQTQLLCHCLQGTQ